jgi:hypothetical protein
MVEITIQALMQLLRDFGVSQAEVARALCVSRAMTTYWAKGQRPLARRQWPAFMALVRGHIVERQDRQAELIHRHVDGWLDEVWVMVQAALDGIPLMLRALVESPAAQPGADPGRLLQQPPEELHRLYTTAANLQWRLDVVWTLGRWVPTIPGADREPRPLARFDAAQALLGEAVRSQHEEGGDVEESRAIPRGGGGPAQGGRRRKTRPSRRANLSWPW